MAPSYVKVTDLRVGLAVEYLGKSDPVPVLDEKLKAIGMVLYSGHPGRIWSTLVQHVQVTWASLRRAGHLRGRVQRSRQRRNPLPRPRAPHRRRVQPKGTRPPGPPRKREKPVRLDSAMGPRRLTAGTSLTPCARR